MTKTKLYSPNADYTGVIAGVAFARGVGELDSDEVGKERFAHLKEWFSRKGYGVGRKADTEEQESQNLKGSVKPLSEMNVEELKEVAKGRGIVGAANMKRDDLIRAIEKADGDQSGA